MATLVATRLVCTNIVSSSGACRLQVLSGTLPYQTIVIDMELTAARQVRCSWMTAASFYRPFLAHDFVINPD